MMKQPSWIRALACVSAGLLACSAWAAAVSGEPEVTDVALMSMSFDGSISSTLTNASVSSVSWGDTSGSYTSSVCGQAFVASDSSGAPYTTNLSSFTTGAATIVLVANVDGASTSGEAEVIGISSGATWSVGTANAIALTVSTETADNVTTQTAKVIVSDGSANTTLVSATIPSTTTGYHLFVVTLDSTNGVSLTIDGTTTSSSTTYTSISMAGFQLGGFYGGATQGSFSSGFTTGAGIAYDELRLYGSVLSSDQISAFTTAYESVIDPEIVATFTIEGTTTVSALTDNLTGDAVATVNGDATLTVDADVTTLTSLTLVAGTPADGQTVPTLKIVPSAKTTAEDGTVSAYYSLYAAGAAIGLTTYDVDVDLTNGVHNPQFTFGGTGDITVRKGLGGIAPSVSNYTGTLTIDDGQQITRFTTPLAVPMTIGSGGAVIHNNSGAFQLTGKLSGSGNISFQGSSTTSISNSANDFSGNATVEAGSVYVGAEGSNNTGADSAFGSSASTITVKSGAAFYTHLGGSSKTYAPSFILEDGSTLGNRDGHVTLTGNIALSGSVAYVNFWQKDNTFSGEISGDSDAVLTLNAQTAQTGTSSVTLSNTSNPFAGTYTVNGTDSTHMMNLKSSGAATGSATVNLANAYSYFTLSGDASAAMLTGSGTVQSSSSSTARALTLSGTSSTAFTGTLTSDINVTVAEGATWTFDGTTSGTVTNNGTLTFTGDTSSTIANSGTLTIPAGTESVLTESSGTLNLVLSSTQLAAGYTATFAEGVTNSATIAFYKTSSDGTITAIEETDGTAADGVYTPNAITYKPTEATSDNTYSWSTTTLWSSGAVPEDGTTTPIILDFTGLTATDVTLTMDAAASLPTVTVKANDGQTVTIDGSNALTVTTQFVLAGNVTATNSTLDFSAGSVTIGSGYTLAYNDTETGLSDNKTLPSIAGSGTLALSNSYGYDLSNTNTYEATIDLKSGVLRAAKEVNDANEYHLTIRSGATFTVGTWTGSLTNSASTVTLEGGATMNLVNGSTAVGSTFAPAITISDASTTPVTVTGGIFGDGTTLSGAISGTGTIAYSLYNASQATNSITISGNISGAVALSVAAQASVTLSGTNTHTGGTVINGNLTVSSAGALGSGTITGSGNMIVTSGITPSNTSGLSDASGWTGTVTLTGSLTNFGLASYGNASSYVEFNGASGYITQGGGTYPMNIILTGNGWSSTNGNPGVTQTFTGALSGSGSLSIANPPANGQLYKFTGDVSGFTGSVTVSGTQRVVFGDSSTASAGNGMITIAKDVTVASGATWTAGSGIAVNAGTLTVAGTVSSALSIATDATLAGTGTVSGATTFADGANLNITGNTTSMGLTFSAEPTLSGTLYVTSDATDAGTIIYKTGSVGGTAAQYMDVTGTSLFASPSTENGYVFIEGATIDTLPSGIDDTAKAEIQELAANYGITDPIFAGTVMGNDISATQLAGALECFDNIISVTPSTSTIDVSYDFGISSIKPQVAEDGTVTLLVTATVLSKDGGTNAAYADGTEVTLTVGANTYTTANATSVDTNTVTWTIDVPDSGTELSVKASNTAE